MKLRKLLLLFSLGGLGYMALELLWRGWTHIAMFFAGGTCFLLLGRIGRLRVHRGSKALLGAGAITAVELLTGLLVNRNFRVWDYRNVPLNFLGQICLPYCLLWIPLGLAGSALYRLLDEKLPSA